MRINSVPRALLLGFIGVYRRRLAGRGPFRNIRCTFCKAESCSAFGERIAHEAPSAWAAVSGIVGRLRRCRDLSLYRFPDGALGWGRSYDPFVRAPSPRDAVCNLDESLRQAGENGSVRAAVREAALLVLSHSALNCRGGPLHTALLVRSATAVRRSLARRFYRRCAISLFFGGLATTAVVYRAGLPLVVMSVLAAALTAASAWASRRLLMRVNRLETLAAIEGPFSPRKPTSPLGLVAPAVPRPVAG